MVKWPKFRPKIQDFGIPWGYCPQKEKSIARTDMYHIAKFHADRCHHRQDICKRTKKLASNLISDIAYTSIAFVNKN